MPNLQTLLKAGITPTVLVLGGLFGTAMLMLVLAYYLLLLLGKYLNNR